MLTNKLESQQTELNRAKNDKQILEETLTNQSEKITLLQQQIIHLESENDKMQQIRSLEMQQK